MINILLLSNFKTAESRSVVFWEQEQRMKSNAIDIKENHLLEIFILTFFIWFSIKLDVKIKISKYGLIISMPINEFIMYTKSY